MSEYTPTPFDAEIDNICDAIITSCNSGDRSLEIEARQKAQVLMAKRDVWLITR